MTTRSRTAVAFVVGFFLIVGAVDASSADVQVPFLFTDDQAAPESDLHADIGPSDTLRTDEYLTAPMTRLEYMLTRIESRLNNENTVSVIKGSLRKRFDRARAPLDEHVEGFARYDDKYGKVVVGYTIENLGRPRTPMRDACHDVLDRLSFTAPQELLGFTYHNTVLGVLAQKGYANYTAVLQKLATHVVHRVTISSQTEDGKVHHTLRCQRAAKNAPTRYEKMSFRLPPSPPR